MSKKTLLGFTLLEIIIAMVIISALIGGVLGSMTYVDRIARDTGTRIIAINHVKEVLERLRNYVTADYASLPAGLTTGETMQALAAGEHSNTTNPAVCTIPGELQNYDAEVTYIVTDRDVDATSNNGNEYKEVTVRITWLKPSG